MLRSFRSLGTDETISQCREAQNIYTFNLFKSRGFYEELVKESVEYPGRLHSYINQSTKRRGNIPELWENSSTPSLVVDDHGRARAFSNYFSNLHIVNMLPPSVYRGPTTHTLDLDTIKVIRDSDLLGESTGPD